MEYGEHFKALFRELEEEHGRLDRKIVGAIVGFSAGGPVSLSTIKRKKIHVTCELSLHEEQKPSAEGLRFELLSVGSFDLPTCRALARRSRVSMRELDRALWQYSKEHQ